MKLSPDDQHLLARLVDAEAADQPVLGRIAVAAVVLNRMALPGYGGPTLRGVVYAPAQFESTSNGRLDNITEPQESTVHAVGVALAGFDPTEGACFYYNPRIVMERAAAAGSANWIVANTRPVRVIADHLFAVARSASR